jgi:hypothetical protein
LLFAAIALRKDQINDPFKFAWGAGVITLFLSVISDIAPEIAGPFALLLLIAVYWKNKDVIGKALPNASSIQTKQPATPNAYNTSPTKGG